MIEHSYKNSVAKGNSLEDDFYDYLDNQLKNASSILEVYPSNRCKLHKKKKYYGRVAD